MEIFREDFLKFQLGLKSSLNVKPVCCGKYVALLVALWVTDILFGGCKARCSNALYYIIIYSLSYFQSYKSKLYQFCGNSKYLYEILRTWSANRVLEYASNKSWSFSGNFIAFFISWAEELRAPTSAIAITALRLNDEWIKFPGYACFKTCKELLNPICKINMKTFWIWSFRIKSVQY